MPSNLPVPEKAEKNLAALSHVSSIFFPIIGPAVAIAISHKRLAFVKCHALSALLDELIWKAILFVGGAVSLAFTIVNVVRHVQEKGTTVTWDDIWPVLLRMGITWAMLLILGLVLTIQSIIQAIRAYRGVWPTRGLSGKLALKLTGADVTSSLSQDERPSAS